MSPVGWRELLEREVAGPEAALALFVHNLEAWRLTSLEREVAVLLLAGYSTKEICAEVGITLGTFYNQISAIGKKVNQPGTDRLVITLTLLGIVRRP